MSKFKKFFIRYSYDCVKMLLTQIVIALFGASVTIAVSGAWGVEHPMMLVSGIGGGFFYLFLLYSAAWRMGDIDRSVIHMGDMPHRPLTGLWVSMIANLPNWIVTVVGLVLSLAKGHLGSIPLIGSFLNGAYMGLLSFDFVPGEAVWQLNGTWWCYLVFTLPSLAICAFAYNMGAKGKMLTKLNAYRPPASDRPTKEERNKNAKCPKCGMLVSRENKECPYCQAPIDGR